MTIIPRERRNGNEQRRRKCSAQGWLDRCHRTGKASAYIKWIDDLPPGQKVVILCRVSSAEQGRNGNLKRQQKVLTEAVEAFGGIVIETFSKEWSGRGTGWLQFVAKVADYAREHHAVILAFATDRLIRHPSYRNDDAELNKLQATERDLREIRDATEGVKLFTYLDPDASPEKCNAARKSAGSRHSSKHAGRPASKPGYCKRRRKLALERIGRLKQNDVSTPSIVRRITKAFGIPRMTAYRWIKAVESRNSL